MEVSYSEGVATHTDSESCVLHREVQGEALTRAQAGQPLSRESILSSGRRRCVASRKAIRGGRVIASAHPVLRGQRPWHACTLLEREPGGLHTGRTMERSASGRVRNPAPMMNGEQKSDSCILAMKPTNKSEGKEAEWVERRRGTEGNAVEYRMCRTQRRISVLQIFDGVRESAHCVG